MQLGQERGTVEKIKGKLKGRKYWRWRKGNEDEKVDKGKKEERNEKRITREMGKSKILKDFWFCFGFDFGSCQSFLELLIRHHLKDKRSCL